jgi:hypothetical protein
MGISAGTYTYGNTGTYATLRAAFIAMESVPGSATATLTGDLTFVQVGDSDDSADFIGYNGSGAQIAILLANFTFTITTSTPHQGCILNGFVTKYRYFNPKFTFQGNFVLSDFYGLGSAGGFGLQPQWTSNTGTSLARVENCIIRCLEPTRIAAQFAPSGAGTWSFQAINSKFAGSIVSLQAGWGGLGADQNRCTVAVENCVMQSTGSGASNALTGPFRLNARDFISGTVPRLNLASWKNNVCVVFDPTTQRAFAQAPGSGAPGTDEAFYRAIMTTNAKTGGIDSNVGFSPYSSITSPADILALTPITCDWLNVNSASALFTAGSAPILTSPYSPPYPIGISYAAPAPMTSLWMPAFVGSL